MKPEKQRIAIAEACGWKNADHPDAMKLKQGWTMPEKWCMDPKGVLRFNHHRPDYLNDLNAMHEAEKTLDYDDLNDMEESVSFHFGVTPFHSTAAQRAEAFLRTIGKWEEEA
jgi:hypothetical protein